MNEENYYLASVMLTENIGCRRARELLKHFNNGEAIWKADREEFENVNLSSSIIEALMNFRHVHPNCPEQLMEFCEKKQIKICSIKDSIYPERLKNIKDPPILLYYRGDLNSKNEKIAIVGTRHPTNYGLRIAEEWAERIASTGVEIVSGAAYGIDKAAHKGALKIGKTIAILGEGLEAVYDNDKKRFLDQIIENGAVVSEYSPNTHSSKGTFPQRNRIISGMSVGVVVIEAGDSSGALNTAQHAGDNGRLLFAVPGSINWEKSKGCNKLIRDGAVFVRSAEDVLEACKLNFDKSVPKAKVSGLPPLDGKEEAVMKFIPTDNGISVDEILLNLEDVEASEISVILLTLENKGYIAEDDFGNYVRAYGN